MTLDQRLSEVRARIADAATKCGRQPGEIRLVGVSKGHGPEIIAEAIQAGLEDVGENRIQEAADKFPAVRDAISRPVTFHLVGHLQSNKARAALDLFDTIESVDSVRIAQRVASIATRTVPVFLEVQFARTPDRFGFDPDQIEMAVGEIDEFPNIKVAGLMTVAPLGLDEDGTRRVFRSLRERRDQVQESHPELGPLELSMGMTDDYNIAIEEGATVVRIGRAIFAG
jgi:pyridoxal phosphate enzyme (YggS family)